jgi:hypothetical protein
VFLQAQEDNMTQMIDQSPASRSLLDMVERASLFGLLQQALEHQKRPQELPGRLYADLGLAPSQQPNFAPHSR